MHSRLSTVRSRGSAARTGRKSKRRKLDVNMLIFEFQSDDIEAKIVDIAKKNPNVTFRIIGDSGQAADSGGNALPLIMKQNLPNVAVKFKKGFPYVWSQSAGRAVYNHGATAGLLHHKGLATFIEGKPDAMLAGSFNWSNTANDKNYEDLMVFRGVDASSRRAISQFGDEFHGFFNNKNAAVGANELSNFKRQKSNELALANGGSATPFTPKPADNIADYAPERDVSSFDLNGFRATDKSRLTTLVGSTVAKAILADRSKFGRYASIDELKARVPSVSTLPLEKLKTLAGADYGSMTVSINNATAEELDLAGLSLENARAIVAFREKNGDYSAVADILNVPGVTAREIATAKKYLVATDVEVFFNSRAFGSTAGGTGYGAESARRTTPVMGAGGTIANAAASVTVAATDMFNRAKPGERVSVAMYGMSATSPEYKSLVEAAKRGASVRVVLNDDYTANTVAALKALKTQGLDVDVRVQKARTMHEKFGVMGDDVFAGSANFSESSSTKHSENRFSVKNSAEIAASFQKQFDLLWEKSKAS